MDIKIKGLKYDILIEALNQAKKRETWNSRKTWWFD
jgi:polyribonucleotide nucleotidyltransferase